MLLRLIVLLFFYRDPTSI